MINIIESNLQHTENKANCPECDSEIEIPSDVEKGEILSCPACGFELEVKKTKNGGECIELQEFSMEGEDWGE